jgi:hypothetical protein
VDESAEERNFKEIVPGSKTKLAVYRSGIEHRVDKTLVIGYQQKAAFLGNVNQTECSGLKEKYAKESARPAPGEIPGEACGFFNCFY